eukprot:Em0015g495a
MAEQILARRSLTSVSTQNILIPPNPNPLHIPNDAHHSDLHWRRLNPLPYLTSVLDCGSLAASFRVEDLLSLAHFLEGGLDCTARTGDWVEQCNQEVPTHSDTKKEMKGKGKVVASGNSGPPGEGWKESSILQLPLATWHLGMTPILEGRSLVEAMLEGTLTLL